MIHKIPNIFIYLFFERLMFCSLMCTKKRGNLFCILSHLIFHLADMSSFIPIDIVAQRRNIEHVGCVLSGSWLEPSKSTNKFFSCQICELVGLHGESGQSKVIFFVMETNFVEVCKENFTTKGEFFHGRVHFVVFGCPALEDPFIFVSLQ